MACKTCGGKKIENSKEFLIDIVGKLSAFLVAIIILPFLFLLLPVFIFRSVFYGKTDIDFIYRKKKNKKHDININEKDIEQLEVVEVK
jgi:hypothetical protein